MLTRRRSSSTANQQQRTRCQGNGDANQDMMATTSESGAGPSGAKGGANGGAGVSGGGGGPPAGGSSGGSRTPAVRPVSYVPPAAAGCRRRSRMDRVSMKRTSVYLPIQKEVDLDVELGPPPAKVKVRGCTTLEEGWDLILMGVIWAGGRSPVI